MKYRSDVKTGVIFADAKNKAKAKEFVKFLLQEENLRPYVEGALGRWFPVTDRRAEEPVLAGRPSPQGGVQPVHGRHACRSTSPRTTSSPS